MSKELEEVQYMRCEACGELHPATECETMIVRLVKGKNCDISRAKLFQPAPGPSKTIVPPSFATAENLPMPPPNLPKRSIIPPGILSVMTPQDMPGAAVEKRIA